MPAAEATVPTGNATAYLTRLRLHAGKMSATGRRLHRGPGGHGGPGDGGPPRVLDVALDGTKATVILDCGQWTMHAEPATLRIRAEAADAGSLRRIQDLLTARLLKLGHRERLTITWRPGADPTDLPY